MSNTDPLQRLREALKAAGAIEGNSEYLTSDELAGRSDVAPNAIDGLLTRLRFEERAVVKGPGDQWRLRDEDTLGVQY